MTDAKDVDEKIRWLDDVEAHDYTAAQSYLGLVYKDDLVIQVVEDLRQSALTRFAAKDIFRASELAMLDDKNSHVQSNWKKIKDKKSISPLLLVRNAHNGKVIVADGYHRLCAVYLVDEDAWVPCKIA
jgi:disulfide oxidoreductase YuzD